MKGAQVWPDMWWWVGRVWNLKAKWHAVVISFLWCDFTYISTCIGSQGNKIWWEESVTCFVSNTHFQPSCSSHNTAQRQSTCLLEISHSRTRKLQQLPSVVLRVLAIVLITFSDKLSSSHLRTVTIATTTATKTKKDKRTQILVIPNKIKGASANKIATAKLEAFQSTSRDNSLSIFQNKVVWNLPDWKTSAIQKPTYTENHRASYEEKFKTQSPVGNDLHRLVTNSFLVVWTWPFHLPNTIHWINHSKFWSHDDKT